MWVVCPTAGFWLGTHPRFAQLGLWMLASIVVLAVGMLQPKRRDCRLFGWLALASLALVATHPRQFEYGSIWLVKAAIILSAAGMIAERGEYRWLRQSVIGLAWLQVPVMILQATNVTIPWHSAHAGFAGTAIKRGACSVLLGAASILSTGWKAWTFCFLSAMTGSLTGTVPAVLRLMWRWKWLAAIGVLASAVIWWPRLMPRLSVWQNLAEQTWNPLVGMGFGIFPLGFQDDIGSSVYPASPLLRDLHSTFIDFTARFGLVGWGIICLMADWVVKSTTLHWQRWFLALALFAGLLQSAEAFPVMVVLALVWWIALNEEGTPHVHPV